MTLSSDGNAALAYRISIDTCTADAVTHPDMLASGSAGVAARLGGLIVDGSFKANADPLACKLTASGPGIKIVDVDGAWSAIFDREPPNTTWLATSCNASVTTITVASTTGFASAGYIWIDSECIAYTNTNATQFLGCTRGALSADSDAATYHYITDGARQRSPEVTDHPTSWEGRRVRIYRYEETDSLQGSGTQVFLGVISTSPASTGTMWTLGVSSIASILEQTIGADLSEPAYPRGIYYPPSAPLSIVITEQAGAFRDSGFSSNAYCLISGFYETQEAFATAFQTIVTAAQAAATNAAGASVAQVSLVTIVSDGPSGWHMQYTTTGAPRYLLISNNSGRSIDPDFGGTDGGARGMTQEEDGDLVYTVAASTGYYHWPSGQSLPIAGVAPMPLPATGIPGAGTVPRGMFDSLSRLENDRWLFLGGSTAVSSLATAALIDWGEDDPSMLEISGQNTATRRIDVRREGVALSDDGPPSGFHAFTTANLPKIRLGLSLSGDSTGSSSSNFMASIVSSQQQYSTLGVVPQLRAGDYNAAGWILAATIGQPALVTKRVYSTFAPISLGDIVREELKLAGCLLGLDSTGRLVPQRLRLAASSEVSTHAAIDSTTLLTDEILLNHEVVGLGQINQVLMRTGYDPVEDEHTGRTWITRDVAAFGRSPSVRQVAIEPKSAYVGPPIDENAVVQCASAIFGVFAGAYSVDTMDVALHHSVLVGEVVVFSNPHCPAADGTIGTTDKPGLVIGVEQGAYSPRARLTVLTTRQKLGGYAPAAFVSAPVNTVGNTWSMTLDTDYFPDGSDGTDWFQVGDRVRVVQFNASSATVVAGTVTVSGATSTTVAFDGVWTPGASTWFLTVANATDATLAATQERFAFIADSAGSIAFVSGAEAARRFGA